MKFFGCFFILYLFISTNLKSQNIILNHALLVVDSTTYQAMLNSKSLKKVALAYEKKFSNWQGFYLIGKDNYLEIFNPKSFGDTPMPVGETWVCLAALKSKTLKTLNSNTPSVIEYDEDERYHYLSFIRKDSSTPITTWEMKEEQYESWTNKKFTENMTFLSTDYNSISESDSSSNFPIKNITSLDLKVSYLDTIGLSFFLKLNGFQEISHSKRRVVYSNNKEKINLFFTKKNQKPQLFRIHFSLNKGAKKLSERIGNSKLRISKHKACWTFFTKRNN